MKDLYVVNCCRTAIGSFGGSLKNTPAAEMGAVVVKEALNRANIAPLILLAIERELERKLHLLEVCHRGRPFHPGR